MILVRICKFRGQTKWIKYHYTSRMTQKMYMQGGWKIDSFYCFFAKVYSKLEKLRLNVSMSAFFFMNNMWNCSIYYDKNLDGVSYVFLDDTVSLYFRTLFYFSIKLIVLLWSRSFMYPYIFLMKLNLAILHNYMINHQERLWNKLVAHIILHGRAERVGHRTFGQSDSDRKIEKCPKVW